MFFDELNAAQIIKIVENVLLKKQLLSQARLLFILSARKPVY